MALINKIRERSGIAVAVIAVALILFIVGGDLFFPNSGRGGLFSGSKNKIGEIAGTSIDAQAFQAKLDAARSSYEQQSGRALQEQEVQQLRNQVWEQMIFDIAYKEEFEKLGLKVTPDELREMIQGTKNLSPMIKQQFTDPQTGQYDRNRHIEFINAAAGKQLPAPQQMAWDQIKESAVQQRLLEKYNALLSASTFVTTAEAKKEYEGQVTKADAKYLYVPYFSVNDTTIKVTDSQLSDYLSKHKKEYVGYDSRSFDYVVYQVAPTKEDSSALYEDIKSFAKGLAAATDPQAYASINSEIRLPYERSASQLGADLKTALATAIPGAVIGPFKEGNVYSIHKYEGTTTDTTYTVRASHILIPAAATAPDSVKASARKRAEELLAQLKQGADFATLARTNSQDGSAQQGGDLGFFNKGRMVKPFDNAVFGFSGTGLIPNIVETEFGYHIIKVTEPKTNIKYKVATISRELQASESTRNAIYQKAETLRASVSSDKEFEEAVKKDPKLVMLKAERVFPDAAAFNTIQNAREVVLWAFNDDTKVGSVSNRVFEIGDNFIVAAIKSKSDKDDPKVDDFRDALTAKVRNEIKAEQIMKKLAGAGSGPLEQIAAKYGAGAIVEAANQISFATGLLTTPGVDPIAIGKIFSLASGKRSKPFVGENGVFIVETTSLTPAPAIADYSQYKTQVMQRSGGFGASYLANQAIRDNANIKDNRAKFF